MVSPSMKYAAACSCVSLLTAGTMFSFQFRISRKSTAPTSSLERNRPSASIPNTARPFFVYEVSKKFTLPLSSWYTFSRYASGLVTAL